MILPIGRPAMGAEEMEAFVGPNARDYLRKWTARASSPWKGWNWAATLCGTVWLVYRKMYAEALIVRAMMLTISFAMGIFARLVGTAWVSIALSAAYAVCMGLLGNVLYYWKMERAFRALADLPPQERQALLAVKGGVSRPAALLVFAAEMGLAYLLMAYNAHLGA